MNSDAFRQIFIRFFSEMASKKRKKNVIPLQNLAKNEDRLAGVGNHGLQLRIS